MMIVLIDLSILQYTALSIFPFTEILIILSTTVIGAFLLFITLSFVVVVLLFHMRNR